MLQGSAALDPSPLQPERGDLSSRSRLWDIRFDRAAGLLRSTHYGLWMPDEADLYADETTRIVNAIRPITGIIRMVSDLRTAHVRPPEAAERLNRRNLTIYRTTDRLALVIDSSLLRIQTQRTRIGPHQETFLSIDAAEIWALAEG